MKRFLFTFLISLTFSFQTFSQDGISDLVAIGTEDVNAFGTAYLAPANNALGVGLNNGWYNTAEVLKPFRFEVKIITNATLVPQEDLTFDINSLNLNNFRVADGQSSIAPTALGVSSAGPLLESTFTTNNTISFNSPEGLGLEYGDNGILPSPMIQVSMGAIPSLEGTVRFVPRLSFDTGDGASVEGGLFGLGAKWDFQRLIPRVNIWPIHLAFAAGFTSINVTSNLNISADNLPNSQNIPDNISFAGQKLEFQTTAFNLALIASKKFPIVTFYASLRYDISSTQLNLQGNFPYESEDTDPVSDTFGELITEVVSDPISLNSSFNQVVINPGVRFKLGPLTFNLDYAIGSQQYNNINFSLGFGRYN